MTNRWEIVPAEDFSDKSQWTANGKNRWSALRVRLLIVSSNGKASRLGPVVIEHDVAPGDTIKLRVKRERIVTSTETISEALRSASKTRILESLSAQIGSELSAKAPGFSGKIKAQTSTQSRTGTNARGREDGSAALRPTRSRISKARNTESS